MNKKSLEQYENTFALTGQASNPIPNDSDDWYCESGMPSFGDLGLFDNVIAAQAQAA